MQVKNRLQSPEKACAVYNFSEKTKQARMTPQEGGEALKAQRKAIRDKYVSIDMTDPKAERAEKRAFNFEHGRYVAGRNAA